MQKKVYLLRFSKWLLCLQLLLTAGVLQAQSVLDKSVVITERTMTIQQLFRIIESETGAQLSYGTAVTSLLTQSVTLDTKKRTLRELLISLKSVGLSYVLNGNFVVIKQEEQAVKPQTGTLSGEMLDELNGDPLPGATVKLAGKVVVTGMDGSFLIKLPAGNYTAEISYIGYGTKEVRDILITAGATFQLKSALKRNKGQLAGVVVKGIAGKETTNVLYLRQKNASEITNGISAEQISRTPDKHIGESLKRISGLSTVDNKYVIVRGIGERYNAAMLDGIALPSTEAQSRNFSFDLIPSNLVDNVIVSKSVTPDMTVNFGGGLIQINTKDIPERNFTSFSAGISYNDQATGKDFFSRKKGKYDFLGFDDGHRGDFPADLQHTARGVFPHIGKSDDEYNEAVTAQSRKFNNHDNFTTYRNTASPSQNYQLSLGRLIPLDSTGKNKMGITGSLSYRNTQSINLYEDLHRGKWLNEYNNAGGAYGYNTTWGALLNIGWQTGNNRFSFRNTYTRVFDNTLVRTKGFEQDVAIEDVNKLPPGLRETDDPVFMDLLQHKLSGLHQAGKVKIEWNLARTSIQRKEKDVIFTQAGAERLGGKYDYFYFAGSTTEVLERPMSRSNYRNSESHYNWNVAASIPFTLGKVAGIFKTGYAGNSKRAHFDWRIVALTIDRRYYDATFRYLPVGQWGEAEHIGPKGYVYSVNPWYKDAYEGKSQAHAGFVMFDNRLGDKLRLVWGLRAEYFAYTEVSNPTNTKLNIFKLQEEVPWQWMPSANFTYSPTRDINLRTSWSRSVVRPESMDNSQFQRYNPYLDGDYMNAGLKATPITSYDVKAEWFPGAGEVISAGVFYKYFERPVEVIVNVGTGNLAYTLRNSDWAKVYGLELEARKNLRFIAPAKWLENIYLYSNLTLQKSLVQSNYEIRDAVTNEEKLLSYQQKRSLYGQVPFLLNAGLLYTGKRIGFNVVYNKSGYKTNIVSENPSLMEFEMPREQLDLQISYKLFNNKLETRFNAGNILNTAFQFYRNKFYDIKPGFDPKNYPNGYEWNDRFQYEEGFNDEYQEGDLRTFTQRSGRTFSFTITYHL
ncbi:TonB-dependent receptor [Chitinophaga nivalis]|uniref:TonB-dependent receptor n=1 Tax=Chitinophaga nivalis TaxID=2991709 RepID=A0ABT3IES3_9BACT|nr:TonB-dependent receptor [Chitinophaga nivalis]MCW3467851.1 TonB-dependent receptor [Chitinophaga nivalis]MCW3482457.1 TonB-dependent receptor [Chitinophaga nivalis]